MFLKPATVFGLALLPYAYSHFTFVRVAVNDEWQSPTRYIRNKTSPYEEVSTPDTNVNTRLYNFPTYATDRPESARCGRDNMAHAGNTEVLSVKSGDMIEIAHQRYEPESWTEDMWNNCPDSRGSCDPADAEGAMDINHPGPFIAHISKVPSGTDVREYDGSGEWVKIYSLGLASTGDPDYPIRWLPWNEQELPARFVFKIPAQTPAGQYLLRVDEVNTGLEEPDFSTSPAQLYPSCVQIVIESDTEGSFPEGINIPEDLSHSSPGMAVSLAMYREEMLDEDYVYPGGFLWDGESLIEDKPVLEGVSA